MAAVPKDKRTKQQLLDELAALRAVRQEESSGRADHWTQMFETLPFGVVFQGADGRILSANRAAEEILGLSLDQMQGRTSIDPRWKAVHEDGSDFPGETHPAMEALQTGRPVNDTVMGVFNPRREEKVWIRVNAVPLFRSGERSPFQVYTTFEDISSRKEIEEALRESEEKFFKAFHASPVVMSLSSLPDGRFLDVNDEFLNLLERTREEVIGRSSLELDIWTDPSQREAVVAAFARELRSRNIEVQWKARSGKVRDMLWSADLVLIGGQTFLLASALDITDRNRAEAELAQNLAELEEKVAERTRDLNQANLRLREEIEKQYRFLTELAFSEKRFRDMAEHTSDWIWEVDGEGRITYSNAKVRDLLGYDPEELRGRHPWELVPYADQKPFYDFIRGKLNRPSGFSSQEIEFLTKEGLGRILEGSGVPFFQPDGRLLGFRGINRDVTAKKRLEVQSLRTRHLAAVGELAGGVAHEINNPLTGIINYAQILADQLEEKGLDPLLPQKIIQEGKRVAGITHDLLAFARETTGMEPLILQDLLQDTLGLTITLLKKEGIGVQLDLPEAPLLLLADRSSLQQIFFSLLSNARFALNQKYSGFNKEKKILIHLAPMQSAGKRLARIVFQDQGTGIPPEILPRIFNPFFSTKPSNAGLGLGLSAILGLVQELGGKIWIESDPGDFTRVIMEIPLV
ncbi:MAG: PAS domain S-box protein [Desulfobacterota bacterium]|nr:PAS domain S-box protein [Thermodesulfobacteriota bacterium]